MDYYDYEPDEVFDDGDVYLDREAASFDEIYKNCILPSLQQFYGYVEDMLFYSFLFRILTNLAQRFGLYGAVHLISIVCGNLTLISIIGSSVFYSVAFIYFIYFAILVIHNRFPPRPGSRHIGYVVAAICLTTLAACELLQWNVTAWTRIRGVQMVASMKVVSLAFDLGSACDSSDEKQTIGFDKNRLPNFISYLGYMFCPTNCVLGPWGPYSEYIAVSRTNKSLDTKTLLWTLVNFVFTIFFALSSNCLVPFIISNSSSTWLVAYRDALSYRCSHYFISYLSQATMVMGGFASRDGSLNYSPIVGYQVVKPLSMELPRSLTEVVTDWNIPMHNWLKQYVFRTARRRSVTLAIFVTYLVSSMLHGMNLQLAAVLLSLGLISLVEHNLRSNVADALNACVRSNRCRNCDHVSKRFTPVTLLVNSLFAGFVVVHLTFLGTVFNLSTAVDPGDFSLKAAIDKWTELNFASYWICFGCFLCDFLLKW